MIEKEADLSEAITLHYCDTWRKVIYDHEYNGEYCTDFNEALAKHQEFIITTDTYKTKERFNRGYNATTK